MTSEVSSPSNRGSPDVLGLSVMMGMSPEFKFRENLEKSVGNLPSSF
jgi:hypothetical protein